MSEFQVLFVLVGVPKVYLSIHSRPDWTQRALRKVMLEIELDRVMDPF